MRVTEAFINPSRSARLTTASPSAPLTLKMIPGTNKYSEFSLSPPASVCNDGLARRHGACGFAIQEFSLASILDEESVTEASTRRIRTLRDEVTKLKKNHCGCNFVREHDSEECLQHGGCHVSTSKENGGRTKACRNFQSVASACIRATCHDFCEGTHICKPEFFRNSEGKFNARSLSTPSRPHKEVIHVLVCTT